MTNLTCDVTSCLNNKNHYCARAGIKIDGWDATTQNETRCLSFGRRGESYENAVSTNEDAVSETDVRCDARHCTFNESSRCTANDVKVCTCGGDACTCGDTACHTFRAK